jgi:hypothetical protein
VIRQAISCDICGTDKQQTNHWFVAYEQNGELRISGWNTQSRLRSGSKHLCGQTCLHKLVDEFMAKTIAVRTPAAERTQAAEKPARTAAKHATPRIDSSLTAVAAHPVPPRPVPVPTEVYTDSCVDEFESSARLIKPQPDSDAAPAAPAFNARTWRAEAWKREREREQRIARRSIA